MHANEKLELDPRDYEWGYDDEDYVEAVKNHPWSVVAHIEWENRMCSYCETRVYQDNRTGLLYLAFDTGCSCPTPFEGHTVADLTPLRSIADWYRHALDHRIVRNALGIGTDLAEYQAMTTRVRELLQEARA